ncbi:MAG: hypothetical protein DLM65_03935 [Candidatus Aeolococcus gillhamiae]|uniref:Glycosyltransferase RgtA/B/C/D-like domain-containing protein n=1 Tax=Candidatus Aeolococcus gillhamiae TaxID=3127015 RepID=A0A2W6AWS8_9BACT|nr:MAG: hypothetical protein DLM65_03935 [Candidatus Dormibacter sp. RRmetagenome_bin12]
MSAMLRRNAWVLGAAVLSLVLTVQPFRDSDVWWHLAVGHYILAHGIPSVEPFSFLHAAHPWVGQQWLYEVGLVRLVDLGGPGLASLVMGVVASAALLIAALSIPAERRPAGPVMAAALLLSALVAAQLLGVRGQVISLFGAALVLHLVMRWRRGSTRVLLALPVVFAVWANLHAGFVIGLGIALVALLTVRGVDRRRRLLLGAAIAASAVATLANPAGPALWGYVAATFSDPTITGVVTEWRSPDFHDVWLRLFEAEAILLVVAWMLAPRRDLFDLVLAGGVFAASLQAQRNVSLFALVAAPQLAVYGAAAWQTHRARLPRLTRLARRRPPPSWFGAALMAVVVGGTAIAVVPQLSRDSAARYQASHEPKAAADYAAAHLAGRRLYSIDTWGGYLAGRFPTGRVVFVYDETGVFGTAALQTYLHIHDLSPDWDTLIRQEGIADAIVPAGAQEAAALHTLGWAVDCRDSTSGSVVMSSTATPGGGSGLDTAPACA